METIIDGKKYTVTHVFNMVGNWYFTDESERVFLVDAENAQGWAEENGHEWKGAETAIAYAKETASNNLDGVFWWKEKEVIV